MEETYCIVDKRKTLCVVEADKRNRFQFYCTCAIRATKNVRYVQQNG